MMKMNSSSLLLSLYLSQVQAMKYCSTRGGVKGVSFREALFAGYASDGGLFVPEVVSKFSPETISEWLKTKPTYPKIVYEIVRRFISEQEIPNNVLEECVKNAYDKNKFDIPSVVGLKNCQNKNGEEFKIAELFHGRTASFKDYALSLVGQLMEYFLNKRDEKVIILVGTSGDTGSAAIKAVEELKGIDIIVLYPDGQVSPVQELQMNSSTASNVHVFAVEGTSDDLDVPIRQSFPGEGLCSINSTNWARVMIQISHFVYLYLQEGDPLDIFVPTGAAGNLVSGTLASLMGIPIKLFVTTNENDNVEALLNKGEFRLGGKVISTPANAMDIRYPYNLERLIYFFSNSPETTAKYLKSAEEDTHTENCVFIEQSLVDKMRNTIGECRMIGTNQIYETINWYWNNRRCMLCPHTATAVCHLESCEKRSCKKSIVISTASPQKFPEVAVTSGITCTDEWNGNDLRHQLEAGPQTQPNRSMKKNNESKWLSILQDEITKIRHSHS